MHPKHTNCEFQRKPQIGTPKMLETKAKCDERQGETRKYHLNSLCIYSIQYQVIAFHKKWANIPYTMCISMT